MIEVELKFILTEAEEKRLLEGATFEKTQEFEDVYFDYQDYRLSTNDIWLRTRNEKFILKLPMPTQNPSLKEQRNSPKHEIENHDEILRYFNIKPQSNLHNDLMRIGINPLYQFKNIRRKYRKDSFIIDLDKAVFPDFVYETCEIELEVAYEHEIDEGIQKIITFATEHAIQIKHVEGRLIEYIRRKNPEHYQKLVFSCRT